MPVGTIRGTCAAFGLLLAAAGAQADGLSDLNAAARAAYAKGRAQLLAAADPVILVVFDEVVLHHRGARRSVVYTPPVYHRLKEVAHLPLGIFGALAPVVAGIATDESWREDLAALARAADAAQVDIAALDLPPGLRRAVRAILEESLGFVAAQRVANARPDRTLLETFARRVAPWTLTLATAAADAQVDGLHAAARLWQEELGAEAWARLHVVVLGPKTPRVDNLAYQYFAVALGPDAAEKRVIYAESIFDEKLALDLLGVLLIDRQVGGAFYGEPGRMERDLLGDAAKVRILRVLGKLGVE